MMNQNQDDVKIIKKVEDLLEQCLKIEQSESVQKCFQLLKLVNSNAHPKAIKFYKNKIYNYWKSIKNDIRVPIENFTEKFFVIEYPLQVDFSQIFEKSTDKQKSILSCHFLSIAALIWPDEFQEIEDKGEEEDLINSIFENLAKMEHLQCPEKTAASVIQHLSQNTELLNDTQKFAQTMRTGDEERQKKVLNHIIQKVNNIEEIENDQNFTELKNILNQLKDRPLNAATAFDLLRQFAFTGAFRYFRENQKEIIENIPAEAKSLVDQVAVSDVYSMLTRECQSENLPEKK